MSTRLDPIAKGTAGNIGVEGASFPRRTALKLMSVGAVTAFMGHASLAQASSQVTRRTLTDMSIDDPVISAYRDFVGMMLANDQSMPVSWLQFSMQHGSLRGGYKYCPHGDWYFLPWHRAYTLMYERAVQSLTGFAAFGMPYWDWTVMRDYPEAFANPVYKGKKNPLYIPNRNKLTGQNALSDEIVGQQLINTIYAETDYEVFGTTRNPDQNNLDPSWVPAGGGYQGELESKPHNHVHNNIGAFMPTPASPRDPIFFMHHSNIDRIWAHWSALGRQNSSDPLWLNMSFTNNYIDPQGKLYSATVKDLQSISDLGYTYDFLPTSDGQTPDASRNSRVLALIHSKTGTAVNGVDRVGGANLLAASALKPFSQKWSMSDAKMKSLGTPAAGASRTEVFALIRDIVVGDNVKAIRVFVNRPDVTPEISSEDPHFAGTFAFLNHAAGHGAAGGHQAAAAHKQLPSIFVNLTKTLQRLYGFRRLNPGEVSIQIIPVPVSGVVLENVGNVVPGSVEIATI